MFDFRASVRTAGVVTGIAALCLCLFAGSAFAWYACKDSGGKKETPNLPTASGPSGHSEKGDNHQNKPKGGDYPSGDHKPKGGDYPSGGHKPSGGDKPGEGSQPAPPPVVESPQVPVGTELLPPPSHPAVVVAPAPTAVPAVVVAPAPTPVPAAPAVATAPVVKGEIGTAWNGSGGEVPTVLAASGEVAQSADQGLARTGFGLLPVAILGALALGGSAFFFRRFQGC